MIDIYINYYLEQKKLQNKQLIYGYRNLPREILNTNFSKNVNTALSEIEREISIDLIKMK